MNFARHGFPAAFNFCGFNTQADSFVVTSDKGYSLYSLKPFRRVSSGEFGQSLGSACFLGHTNLVAIGGKDKESFVGTKEVVIYDDKHRSKGPSLPCVEEVTGIHFSEQMLVVTMTHRVSIFRVFRDEHNRLSISTKSSSRPRHFETSDDKGIFAIGSHHEHPSVAFPAKEKGVVHVVIPSKGFANEFKVAENDIACLALNSAGTLLAAASERGTEVHVYDVATGKKLKDLRRGTKPARIFSLAFNTRSDRVACISDHGTLHVFVLDVLPPPPIGGDMAAAAAPAPGPEEGTAPIPSEITSSLVTEPAASAPGLKNAQSMFRFIGGYLGGYVSIVKAEWSALKYSFDAPTVPSVVMFGPSEHGEDLVFVIRGNGAFYELAVNGGQLELNSKTDNFLDMTA